MRRLSRLLILLLAFEACGHRQAAKARAGSRPGEVFRAPAGGIELRRGVQPLELVRIGTSGVVIGPADGPRKWKPFADRRRADFAWYLLQTYAPFARRTSAAELVFRGHGTVKSGDAEQRMLFEWARETAAEAAGGRRDDAYGLLLAWHQGSSAGGCEDVVLYLTGEVIVTACGWEGETPGYLESGSLDRIYGWFDRLAPFQVSSEAAEPRPGSQQIRLIFAGRGAERPTAADEARIQAFAASLFAELAARRRGGAPTSPADPDEPAGSASPIPHLLLPPSVLTPKPREVVLDLPERSPPVPGRTRPPQATAPTTPPP